MASQRLYHALPWLMLMLLGCAQYEAFDSVGHVEGQFDERLEPALRARVEVPFALDEEVRQAVEERLSPAGGEKRRTEEVLEFIFGWLDLRYSLTPTRNAVETFHAREGNCLSFVNLFVGIARYQRLNPFYVEVQDYQRWNYRDGVVVSRGHIVAGMYVDGDLSTFDFLPYRPKSYRRFKPIDDLTAAAHYYNNLGAEALMAGDLDRSRRFLGVAVHLAPDFDKALNNFGLVLLRSGRVDEAVETLRRGLELHPENVPLLTNLARAYQQAGRLEEANALLAELEEVNETSPFFFVYRGEQALDEGDYGQALQYMKQALAKDSQVPEVHLGLAKTYLALGELERARHHLERALRLDATNQEARRFAALLAAQEEAGER